MPATEAAAAGGMDATPTSRGGDPGGASAGPPVVLFPSLAGTVLECRTSPVDGFEPGQRIWMEWSALMAGRRKSETSETKLEFRGLGMGQHSAAAVYPFVQHIALDPASDGQDNPGFSVRPKEGLAGCEYLSDSPLIKDSTYIMARIADMLREHGYNEWDGTRGSMIGEGYDWRLAPPQLEARDQYFSRLVEQTEAMVQANRQPAVLIGFSLGCRIAKYFLHFAHDTKGAEWLDEHVQHFVPLGGPFLGSVALLQAVMLTGTFPPLDMLFSQAEMLTILRSVPVSQYLLPVGDWHDGLDLPFVYLRETISCRVFIGQLHELDSCGEEAHEFSLRVKINGTRVVCHQSLDFHSSHPFAECISYSLPPDASSICAKITLLYDGFPEACATHTITSEQWAANGQYSGQIAVPLTFTKRARLRRRLGDFVHAPESDSVQAARTLRESQVGRLDLRFSLTVCEPGNWFKPSEHALAQHSGGQPARYDSCTMGRHAWSPASTLALHDFEEMHKQRPEIWQVPDGSGGLADCHSCPPPVARVTAIYGVNLPTPRTLFLRHPAALCTGGAMDEHALRSCFELDASGDYDGLACVDGVGYETSQTPQFRPGDRTPVFMSGDGTVPYWSLRHAATWRSEHCQVQIHELPDCDHRGVSSDSRMLHLLEGILGLCSTQEHEQLKQEIDKAGAAAQERWSSSRCAGNDLCAGIAKLGSRRFDQLRTRFRLLVVSLAVISLLACGLALVYGASEDYGFISAMSWASGGMDLKGSSLSGTGSAFIVDWDPKAFDLGVLTYAYLGDMITQDVTYLQTAGLIAYEYDASCSTATQTYSQLIFQYGAVSQVVAFRPASIKLCVKVNCQTHALALQEYSDTAECVGLDSTSDLWGGLFSDNSCVTATFAYQSTTYSMGLRGCDSSVETNIDSRRASGQAYLPTALVYYSSSAAVAAQIVAVLGGMTASAFDAAAKAAFKDTIAASAGSVCGWSGTSACTATDVTIVSSSRRNLEVTFALTARSDAWATEALSRISSYMETEQFITDLGARSVIITSAQVTESSTVSEVAEETCRAFVPSAADCYPIVYDPAELVSCTDGRQSVASTCPKYCNLAYECPGGCLGDGSGSLFDCGTVCPVEICTVSRRSTGPSLRNATRSASMSEHRRTTTIPVVESSSVTGTNGMSLDAGVFSYTGLTCTSLTSGVLSTSDGEVAVTVPYDLTVSGQVFAFYCISADTLVQTTRGLPTGEYQKCVNTYQACVEVGHEGTGLWKHISYLCNKGLDADMCKNCYQAGIETYIILAITCAVQLPLVWLSIVRTSPLQDSRCSKFMSLPLAATVIAGSLLAYLTWYLRCYDGLEDLIDDSISEESLQGFVRARTEVNWNSMLPLLVASLVLSVSVVSMFFHVPEPWGSVCRDPRIIEPKPNSVHLECCSVSPDHWGADKELQHWPMDGEQIELVHGLGLAQRPTDGEQIELVPNALGDLVREAGHAEDTRGHPQAHSLQASLGFFEPDPPA